MCLGLRAQINSVGLAAASFFGPAFVLCMRAQFSLSWSLPFWKAGANAPATGWLWWVVFVFLGDTGFFFCPSEFVLGMGCPSGPFFFVSDAGANAPATGGLWCAFFFENAGATAPATVVWLFFAVVGCFFLPLGDMGMPGPLVSATPRSF